MTYDEFVKKHFPAVDPGVTPGGNKILVQLRTVPKTSGGGIVLVNDTREFNNGNTQIALVRKFGQIAFRSRETGEAWREGAWCVVGDVIIIPAYGGFRFSVPIEGTEDDATFAVFNDFDVQLVVNDRFDSFSKIL